MSDFQKCFAVNLGVVASLEDGTVYLPHTLTATGRIPTPPEMHADAKARHDAVEQRIALGRPFEHCAFDHGCVQERLCGKYGRCAWGVRASNE